MTLRVYLSGGVCVLAGGLLEERALPGRQGRLLLAMLAHEDHAWSRDALAEELWGERLPDAWDANLRALVSKLRRLLHDVGLRDCLLSGLGCYELRLPGAWIDTVEAPRALHRAEVAFKSESLGDACGHALGALAVSRRPFLPGEPSPWAGSVRDRLQDVRVRTLELLAEVWIRRQDAALAVRDATEAVELAPFRETAHRLLIRAHAESGNRPEALLAYERCRRLLADELGVEPSPETRDVQRAVLRV